MKSPFRERKVNRPEQPPGTGTIAFAREASEMFASWPTDPGLLVDEVDAGGPRALWVGDQQGDSRKVLLYFHGGAYIIGTADHVVSMLGHVANGADCRALSVDYRLAPEHPFPAAVEDAVAAYKWLLDHDHQPTDVVVGGDSAGGGVGLAMLLAARDQGLPMPAGVVAISPWGISHAQRPHGRPTPSATCFSTSSG